MQPRKHRVSERERRETETERQREKERKKERRNTRAFIHASSSSHGSFYNRRLTSELANAAAVGSLYSYLAVRLKVINLWIGKKAIYRVTGSCIGRELDRVAAKRLPHVVFMTDGDT